MAIPEQISVRLDWSEAETCPAQHVNQILTQVGPPSGSGVPDGIYVAVGSVAPPLILPPDEASRALRISELVGSTLKVKVHGRIHLSREALDDFIRVLQTTAGQYDLAVQNAGAHQAPGQG